MLRSHRRTKMPIQMKWWTSEKYQMVRSWLRRRVKDVGAKVDAWMTLAASSSSSSSSRSESCGVGHIDMRVSCPRFNFRGPDAVLVRVQLPRMVWTTESSTSNRDEYCGKFIG